MKRILNSLTFLLICGSLYGGTPAPSPVAIAPSPSNEGWWFRAAPYGWLTAIEGDVSVGRLSAPVDISMSDTLNDLDMAAMGVFEAGYGRWSLGVDLVYAKTSQDLAGGGRLFDSFRYEQKQWLITPTVAYRVIDTGRYHMSLVAGARVTVMEADLTGRFVGGGQVTRGADTSWVDPIVGIRGQAEIGDRWFFRYYGDVGGFGASSDLIWQAYAGFGYHFTEFCAIALGYRGLGIDYSKDAFSLDTVTHGPVIGIEFRF